MAIGFPAKFSQTVSLKKGDILSHVSAIEQCLKELQWEITSSDLREIRANTNFSLSSWGEVFTIKFTGNEMILTSSCKGTQLIDWGKNKRNIKKFLESWNKQNQTISEMFSGYSANENFETEHQVENSVWAGFLPSKGFFVTPSLIIINLLVFVAMVVSGVHIMEPASLDLVNWGANFRPLTSGGEWWRLFTCCFIHIGILHVLMNMYALMYVGLYLERIIGSVPFLILYLLTGVVSSVASLWWHDFTISAGASGAVFGMYGVFLALLLSKSIDEEIRKALLPSIGIFIGYNLLAGAKGGIDNAAHIGGLLSGFVSGFALIPALRSNSSSGLVSKSLIIISVVFMAFSYFVAANLSNDIPKYEKLMEEFSVHESAALKPYSLLENEGSSEDIIAAFSGDGMKEWLECKRIITEAIELDLPEHIRHRNGLLYDYISARIVFSELVVKTYGENTDAYNAQIDSVNNKIELLFNELSAH